MLHANIEWLLLTLLAEATCRTDPEATSSPMQDALVRVFARIVDADNAASDPGQLYIARLMLLPPQIGSIMGKGGRTISQIRRESGTNIRILQPGDMPPCAMAAEPHAQLVQVGCLLSSYRQDCGCHSRRSSSISSSRFVGVMFVKVITGPSTTFAH